MVRVGRDQVGTQVGVDLFEQRFHVVRRRGRVERGIGVAVLRQVRRIRIVEFELEQQRLGRRASRGIVLAYARPPRGGRPLGGIAVDQRIVVQLGRDVERGAFELEVVGVVAPHEFVRPSGIEHGREAVNIIGKMPAVRRAASKAAFIVRVSAFGSVCSVACAVRGNRAASATAAAMLRNLRGIVQDRVEEFSEQRILYLAGDRRPVDIGSL